MGLSKKSNIVHIIDFNLATKYTKNQGIFKRIIKIIS